MTIVTDIIENTQGNTLLDSSSATYDYPTETAVDHHASQILQTKIYYIQPESEQGVVNSDWTCVGSVEPLDFRLSSPDNYVYIFATFIHRTVSGTPDDSHSYVSLFRSTPDTTTVAMSPLPIGNNFSQTDITWINLFDQSSVKGYEIEYNGQYTNGEKWSPITLQYLDTTPSVGIGYSEGHVEKFSYAIGLKQGPNGSNGQISLRNGVQITLMEIQKYNNYVPRRPLSFEDDPNYFVFTDTIVEGDFTYDLTTKLVAAGWTDQIVIAQITADVDNYSIRINKLNKVGNLIEFYLKDKIISNYDPNEGTGNPLFITREIVSTQTYNLQTHFTSHNWDGTAKIDAIINASQLGGNPFYDNFGIVNSSALPAESLVYIVTTESVVRVDDPLYLIRWALATSDISTDLIAIMLTNSYDNTSAINGRIKIPAALTTFGIKIGSILPSNSVIEIEMAEETLTVTDRLFLHREISSSDKLYLRTSMVAKGWPGNIPVNSMVKVATSPLGILGGFNFSENIFIGQSNMQVKFMNRDYNITSSLTAGDYIYFESISTDTSEYAFSTIPMTSAGWLGTNPNIYIGIIDSVVVYTQLTTNYAFDIANPTLPSGHNITIVNAGTIVGAGGTGGAAGTYNGSPSNGLIGSPGGNTINLNYSSLNITLDNYGTIVKGFGGAGGGGAGGAGPGWGNTNDTAWGDWILSSDEHTHADFDYGFAVRFAQFYTGDGEQNWWTGYVRWDNVTKFGKHLTSYSDPYGTMQTYSPLHHRLDWYEGYNDYPADDHQYQGNFSLEPWSYHYIPSGSFPPAYTHITRYAIRRRAWNPNDPITDGGSGGAGGDSAIYYHWKRDFFMNWLDEGGAGTTPETWSQTGLGAGIGGTGGTGGNGASMLYDQDTHVITFTENEAGEQGETPTTEAGGTAGPAGVDGSAIVKDASVTINNYAIIIGDIT